MILLFWTTLTVGILCAGILCVANPDRVAQTLGLRPFGGDPSRRLRLIGVILLILGLISAVLVAGSFWAALWHPL